VQERLRYLVEHIADRQRRAVGSPPLLWYTHWAFLLMNQIFSSWSTLAKICFIFPGGQIDGDFSCFQAQENLAVFLKQRWRLFREAKGRSSGYRLGSRDNRKREGLLKVVKSPRQSFVLQLRRKGDSLPVSDC
jgi:hypothetical protein